MKQQPFLWAVSVIIIISGAGQISLLAKDVSGKDEAWTAPSEAARKHNPVQANEQSLGHGKDLYAKQCSPCHGPTGKGDGSKASELKRKPADLTNVGSQGEGELFWKITEGKSPMPSFDGKLSDQDRWEIVAYIRTFGSGKEVTTPGRQDDAGQPQAKSRSDKYVSREEHEKLKAELEALKAQLQQVLGKEAPSKAENRPAEKAEKGASPQSGGKPWVAPRGARAAGKRNPIPAEGLSIERGKEHFSAECVACHGTSGKGDGPKAAELDRMVTDLSDPATRQQTDGELFWKITEGRTPMPSFKSKFSDTERWHIVNFIRTLASKTEQTNQAPAKTLDQAQDTSGKTTNRPAEKQPAAKASKEPAEKPAPKEQPEKPASDQSQALEDLRSEVKQIKQMAKESFPGTSKLLLTGYGSAGFTAQDHGGDNFFSATLNPILLWKLSDRLLFEGELEAELEDHETTIALEMAQMSFVLNDYMTLGAGKFLDPMNYFVERQHMAWVNKLPDKPLAVYDGLLPESNVGFQVRGGVPVGPTKFGYAVYVANAPELRADTNKVSASDLGTLEFDNFQNVGRHVAVGGRLGFYPIPDLELGYGVQFADVTPPGSPEHVNAFLHSVDASYVNDSRVLKGILNLKAQWVWSRVDRLTYDPDGTIGGPFLFANNRDGGYVQAAYRPSKVGITLIKDIEAVVRYDVLNQARTQTGFDERRFTLGLNYWFGPSTVLKAAYELDRQSGPNAGRHNAIMVQFAIGF